MFRFAVLILCLAVSAQGLRRVSRLPDNVAKRMGEQPEENEDKIVGGTTVTPNSIPFQVSWQYTDSFHFCGGAILDKSNILTAAHCCHDIHHTATKIVAGEHDLSKDEGTEQEITVANIIEHPDYNKKTFENDVCILQLKTPLTLNEYVSEVTLPRQDQSFENGDAVVSGWGTTSSGGSSPNELRSVTVPIVSDADCGFDYGGEFHSDSMICAGEGGKDSCQGDSGGPMTCGDVHCGVVSWGYGCAVDGYPGVYAKTSHYVDWISQMTV